MSDTEIDVLVAESLAPIELDVAEDGEQIQLDVSECIGGGGGVDVNPLAVIANGVYTAPEGEAYSPVTVNVPQPSGTKTINISQNGTITENVNDYASAEIVVAIPVPTLDALTATDNGTYTPASGHAYSSVVVAIPSASGVSF